jgi:hypothetical protein
MAVIALFRNLHRPVREQLDGLAHDLPTESAAMSAQTRALLDIRRVNLILQRLEAGQ